MDGHHHPTGEVEDRPGGGGQGLGRGHVHDPAGGHTADPGLGLDLILRVLEVDLGHIPGHAHAPVIVMEMCESRKIIRKQANNNLEESDEILIKIKISSEKINLGFYLSSTD